MFGRLQGWYMMYTFSGALAPDRILPGEKFTLPTSLAFYIGSVTARYSSSGRQPNFAALNRGRHLRSAERLSRWTLAHILIFLSSPSSPNLSGRRLDVYHTLAHGVALVRI